MYKVFDANAMRARQTLEMGNLIDSIKGNTALILHRNEELNHQASGRNAT